MNKYDPNFVPNHARFLLGVKVLVINKDSKVLVLKRSDKVSRSGGWDFPGGGVDKGESPDAAAIRELNEETSLKVSQLKLVTAHLAKTNNEDDLIIGYLAVVDDQQVKLTGWEHDDFQWITLKELEKIELPQEHSVILAAYKTAIKLN